MYESFYGFREKPFTLLPDPGFLYLSDKHRLALTLLEYGLMNQAGFTVISGDIGTGKTTLIRHLLENMEHEHTVGLISNTHSSFGDLLQWVLLAFNLDHSNLDQVEMYRKFVDFVISEYAHNRRTVLIVDEAQNMSAETLEELRMLSNINADKNQILQIILVGQRELRGTLQRPDLVQFAQRIAVDYHLEPLSEQETIDYIRHRLQVAGGDPDLLDAGACRAVHRYTNGVPRLINLLCDTALVYGFAGQNERINSDLVTEIAREKQQGGIFPTYAPAEFDEPEQDQAASAPVDTGVNETTSQEAGNVEAVEAPVSEPEQNHNDAGPEAAAEDKPHEAVSSPRQVFPHINRVRIAIASVRANLCHYLSRLMESHGFIVVSAGPLNVQYLKALDPGEVDILVIDRFEDVARPSRKLAKLLEQWPVPILYNDSTVTELSLQQANPRFGQLLSEQINALASSTRAVKVAVQ